MDTTNTNGTTITLIIVSICGDKSTTIQVEPSDPIFGAKAKIIHGCTPDWNLSDCMRLLYNGKLLDDAHTVAHYNISDGSTLYALKRCRVRTCRHEKPVQDLASPGSRTHEVARISAACRKLTEHGIEVTHLKLFGWALRYHPRSARTTTKGSPGDWYATSPEGVTCRSHKALQRIITAN